MKPNAKQARPRPVLMIPVRRCGSHAIRLRINESKQFYSPYPLHIVDFMPAVPSYGDLKDNDNYLKLIKDIIKFQEINVVKWDISFDPYLIFESIKDEPRSIHRIVWELLFEAGRKNNASVVMDKSLDSVYYAGELMGLFDDMLFLNVVRDPRAQVNSMTKAIIHEFEPTLNAIIWKNAHETAKNIAEKYPDRVLTVRFEDFIHSQEQVLRNICQFFKIDYLPEMLDISKSTEAQKISKMSALWKSNANHPIPANVDKFKQHLTIKEIEAIESVTGHLMDFYGYQRMTDAKLPIDDTFLQNCRSRSKFLRQKAWDNLKLINPQDYQSRKRRADYLSQLAR